MHGDGALLATSTGSSMYKAPVPTSEAKKSGTAARVVIGVKAA